MEDEFSNRKTGAMKSNFHYFVTNDGMEAFNEISKEEKEKPSKDSQDFVNEFKRCLFQEYDVLPHTLYNIDVLGIVKGNGKEKMTNMEWKFRAYDSSTKQMQTSEEVFINNGIVYLRDENTGGLVAKKELIAMLCTGVKDTKGNEIYDGDIIKIHDNELGTWHQMIFWSNKKCLMFQVRERTDFGYVIDDEFSTDYSNFESYEVVGNIYENPELLELI